MFKLFASILITFSLITPTAFAADASGCEGDQKDSSCFKVLDILNTKSSDSDTGYEATSNNLVIAGEAEGGPGSGIAALILRAINILTLLIGTFAIVMIIIGGMFLVISQGDQNKIDRGKAIITQSLFGLVVAFFSYLIVVFIQSFFY